MISWDTGKDIFWSVIALMIVATHLVTAYFMVIPRHIGIVIGIVFLVVSFLTWFYHEKAGLAPLLVAGAAIIPIGHGHIYHPYIGWTAVKWPLLIYVVYFGAAYLTWISQKALNRFSPG